MKALFTFILLITYSFTNHAQTSALHLGERHTFESTILKETRAYEVYLPKDYTSTQGNTYPVLYVMDGDYNFQFITGVVDMLTESGKIPSLIVVSIGDKGTKKYRNYCRPTVGGTANGAADMFMDFIQTELKIAIKKYYRASGYSMIMGHSMGGLFTTNYWLTHPADFNDYIAIDPSLWWNDYEIAPRADSLLASREAIGANIYLSLASTKGMGVLGFVGVLDKYYSNQKDWHFNHYKNDNHGSVALPSIKFALENIFEDWVMTEAKYRSFENITALFESYVALKKDFDTEFALPTTLLSNSIYYEYQKSGAVDAMEVIIRKEFPASVPEFIIQKAMIMKEFGELDEALALLKEHVASHPNSYQAHDALCQLYLAQKQWRLAQASGEEALRLAQQLDLRLWMLNQIEGHILEAKEEK